ncbi:MAG TPA: DoxX family protein [Spirochaetia bacterium]|nr:DoxX family protein [Spirochaetia bacterium]
MENAMKDTEKNWVSYLWLVVRVYAGWEFMSAGIGKLGSAAWVGNKAPSGIIGFLKNGIALSHQPHAVPTWYGAFLAHVALPSAPFFSYLIPYGEFFAGLGLVLGCFTSIAVVGAALMNLNYMLAGSISTNPQLYTLEMILLIALFVGSPVYAIGVDRFLMPYLKTKYPILTLRRNQPEKSSLDRRHPGDSAAAHS